MLTAQTLSRWAAKFVKPCGLFRKQRRGAAAVEFAVVAPVFFLLVFGMALGDADVFLDAIPDYTLVDVAQNISRLDFSLLKRSLTKHSSGLYLLPRPVQLQDASLVSPDDLTRVLGLLKATFTHLIIDCSKSYNELDFVALKSAKDVLLITQLDLPCLRNVVRLMFAINESSGRQWI